MKAVLMALAAGWAQAQTPEISQIMARAAENQTKSLEQRKDWVYHQKQVLRMHRGNGKLAREEQREYTVTPDVASMKRELTHFAGKYESKGSLMPYSAPGYQYPGISIRRWTSMAI